MDSAGWLALATAAGTVAGALLGKYGPRWFGLYRQAGREDRKEARADQAVVIRHLQDHIRRLDGVIDKQQEQIGRLHELVEEYRRGGGEEWQRREFLERSAQHTSGLLRRQVDELRQDQPPGSGGTTEARGEKGEG